MNESPIEATKRIILAGALKHYDKQRTAEWTKEELGDNFDVYQKVAKELEEAGWVDMSTSSFGLLRVRLTADGKTYCSNNAIS